MRFIRNGLLSFPLSFLLAINASAAPKKASKAPDVPDAPVKAQADSPVADSVNPAFAFTHLLPSPLTLPGGTFIVGTEVAYGVTDFLELGTNVLRDTSGVVNLFAKVPTVSYSTFMASVILGWQTFNYHHIDNANPDLRINAWQPGIVTALELDDTKALFFGGNLNLPNKDVPRGTVTSGYAKGAQAELDFSWLYNPASSRLGSNAISTGVTYDITYGVVGFGFTHHWPALQLGLHYFVNANGYRVMPIIGLGVGVSF